MGNSHTMGERNLESGNVNRDLIVIVCSKLDTQ